jgi:hypothetical protein
LDFLKNQIGSVRFKIFSVEFGSVPKKHGPIPPLVASVKLEILILAIVLQLSLYISVCLINILILNKNWCSTAVVTKKLLIHEYS